MIFEGTIMTFNPAAETARYIDSLGPAALQKAADYTSASQWMLLWGLLVSALVTWIIVRSGILDKVSAKLESRASALRILLVSVTYFLVSAIVGLPWGIYEEWGFEKSYGRTEQPIADFLMQDAIGIAISTVLGGLFFLGVYALMRRAGKRWWLWAGGFAGLAISFGLLVSPILIEPLFNDYKPVPAGPVRTALLVMADDAGIPHDRLLMYDGSRQSNNFTANVSGVFGSEGHIWRTVIVFALLAMVGFYLADRLFPRFAKLFGSSARVDDPVGLPVLLFIVTLFGIVATPTINFMVRQGERDADNYSLRTVNLPDALSAALVKTAEYRYPRPSALQEALFYTHPSVEWRVRNAMEWKKKQMVKDVQKTPKS
jgi:STE24 endopeptidase